jgi:hypothetical protein
LYIDRVAIYILKFLYLIHLKHVLTVSYASVIFMYQCARILNFDSMTELTGIP